MGLSCQFSLLPASVGVAQTEDGNQPVCYRGLDILFALSELMQLIGVTQSLDPNAVARKLCGSRPFTRSSLHATYYDSALLGLVNKLHLGVSC
jgi:hypothetical protein